MIDRSGLAYKLGPLGTCIEGEWVEVMAVITQCFEHLSKQSNRIACTRQDGLAQGPQRGAGGEGPVGRGQARAEAENVTAATPDGDNMTGSFGRIRLGRPTE